MLKVRYTCSDPIMAMARDYVVLSIPDPDRFDVYSIDTWKRVKRTFARRHRTSASYVNITAVEYLAEK